MKNYEGINEETSVKMETVTDKPFGVDKEVTYTIERLNIEHLLTKKIRNLQKYSNQPSDVIERDANQVGGDLKILLQKLCPELSVSELNSILVFANKENIKWDKDGIIDLRYELEYRCFLILKNESKLINLFKTKVSQFLLREKNTKYDNRLLDYGYAGTCIDVVTMTRINSILMDMHHLDESKVSADLATSTQLTYFRATNVYGKGTETVIDPKVDIEIKKGWLENIIKEQITDEDDETLDQHLIQIGENGHKEQLANRARDLRYHRVKLRLDTRKMTINGEQVSAHNPNHAQVLYTIATELFKYQYQTPNPYYIEISSTNHGDSGTSAIGEKKYSYGEDVIINFMLWELYYTIITRKVGSNEDKLAEFMSREFPVGSLCLTSYREIALCFNTLAPKSTLDTSNTIRYPKLEQMSFCRGVIKENDRTSDNVKIGLTFRKNGSFFDDTSETNIPYEAIFKEAPTSVARQDSTFILPTALFGTQTVLLPAKLCYDFLHPESVDKLKVGMETMKIAIPPHWKEESIVE